MKKKDLLEKINNFVNTILPETEVKPEEVKTEMKEEVIPEEVKPEEKAPESVLEVGKPLLDGEYVDKDGNKIVLKSGLVETITPKEEKAPEEVKEEKVEMSAQEKPEDIKVSLKLEIEKEYTQKLEDIKKEFNLKLDKIAESVKGSGIIQAPITETKKEFVPMTAKDIILDRIDKLGK